MDSENASSQFESLSTNVTESKYERITIANGRSTQQRISFRPQAFYSSLFRVDSARYPEYIPFGCIIMSWAEESVTTSRSNVWVICAAAMMYSTTPTSYIGITVIIIYVHIKLVRFCESLAFGPKGRLWFFGHYIDLQYDWMSSEPTVWI